MAKLKMKLTVHPFRATYYIPPPISALRIIPVNEGTPIKKPDKLPEEPLIPRPSVLIIN